MANTSDALVINIRIATKEVNLKHTVQEVKLPMSNKKKEKKIIFFRFGNLTFCIFGNLTFTTRKK